MPKYAMGLSSPVSPSELANGKPKPGRFGRALSTGESGSKSLQFAVHQPHCSGKAQAATTRLDCLREELLGVEFGAQGTIANDPPCKELGEVFICLGNSPTIPIKLRCISMERPPLYLFLVSPAATTAARTTTSMRTARRIRNDALELILIYFRCF